MNEFNLIGKMNWFFFLNAGRAIQAVPMTLSSGLDPKSVYHPPSTLQLPGRGNEIDHSETNLSRQGSLSSSSSQSSIGSSHGIQKELASQGLTEVQTAPSEVTYLMLFVNLVDIFWH